MHGRERMMKRGERPVLAGKRSLRPSDGVTPLGRYVKLYIATPMQGCQLCKVGLLSSAVPGVGASGFFT